MATMNYNKISKEADKQIDEFIQRKEEILRKHNDILSVLDRMITIQRLKLKRDMIILSGIALILFIIYLF